MSRTKKFKMTDLGPIPEDWEVRTLGEIGDPLMCKRILKSQTKECGDVPFYKIGTFGDKPDAYIDRSVFEYFRDHYSYPRKGDILLSAAGTIGRVVVFDGKDSYFQDSNIVWIRNDESKVLNEYLKLCYQTTDWQTEDGGSVSRLYNDNLKSTKIKFPVAAEQRRIAAALSDADELIAALTELLEKKRNLKQGAMQQLLTGKRRLPGFKGKWVERSIGSLCKICNGRDYKHLSPGDIPVYGTGGEMARVSAWLYDGETVCIGRKGTIDQPQYHSGKIWTVDTLFYTSQFNGVVPKWLYYKFLLVDWKSYNAASGVPSLTSKNIEQIELSLPQEIEEQCAIAEVLTDMDEEIAGIEAELEKAKNVKTGMMQQLLTGKVRLEEA